MEEQIKSFFKSDVKIDNEKSIEKIYNLIKNNEFIKPSNSVEYFYYGKYYDIEKNYDLMKKYYLMGIEQNHSDSMNNLGVYYDIGKNYDLMKKYYLMAIEQNHSFSMNNLGLYYHNIEKNYDLMKKYYLMGIEQNHSTSMFNLGNYYQNVKDYDPMKKYYLMSIEQNNSSSINNLLIYYNNIDDYSFVNLYKYQNNTNEKLLIFINEKFKNGINLPKEFYYSFCRWDFSKEIFDEKIMMKQYILKTTGVFPSNYNGKYLIHFMEILKIQSKSSLPKDIMLLISGHLFV